MDKKDIIISILTAFLIVSGISIIHLISISKEEPKFFIDTPKNIHYGVPYLAEDVDPHYLWDPASIELCTHIWEGLFAINLSDPQFSLIPQLATSLGSYSSDGKELTVPLKRGVKFHDGTSFNAEAVKFSFDRLHYLLNVSGTLPMTCYYHISSLLYSLYEWPDGTPIINRTEILDTYTIKFVLNRQFGPFRYLLTFPGSYILSPYSTPSNDYINPSMAGPNNCVETGPFILKDISTYVIRIQSYDDYHLCKSKIDELRFIKISDNEDRNRAVLSGAVDIIIGGLYSFYDEFEEDDDIVFFDDFTSWSFKCVRIFNQEINSTWRKAISFAINYSRILSSFNYSSTLRLNSILAPNIFGYDPTIKPIDHNITFAREVMINMGFGNASWNDFEWRAAEFASWNFSYTRRADPELLLYEILKDNLDQIGINLIEGTESYFEWLEYYLSLAMASPPPYVWYNRQNFVFSGWYPDYNDAYQILDAFFSSVGWFSKYEIITDPWIEQQLEQALLEVNDTARAALYSEIQRYNNEEFFPTIYLYHNPLQYIHDKRLINVPYSPTGLFYAYPIEFEN